MPRQIRLTRGLWRPAELIDDDIERSAALLSVCGPDAVIAGLTAARLHGLWVHDRPTPFEVIVHPDQPCLERRSHHRRAEIRSRRQALQPDEVVTRHGLPLTSEARTWLDLADRLSLPDLVAAGDSVLRNAVGTEALETAVGRARHHRGVVRARTSLNYLDGRSRSRPESLLRCAIVHAGQPVPEVNQAIYSDTGEWLAEPDLSYDDVRLAIEYNGADHADLDRTRRDITRELDVEDRGGWRMVVFGPAEVFRRPDQIPIRVARLRHELRQLRPPGDWALRT